MGAINPFFGQNHFIPKAAPKGNSQQAGGPNFHGQEQGATQAATALATQRTQPNFGTQAIQPPTTFKGAAPNELTTFKAQMANSPYNVNRPAPGQHNRIDFGLA